MTRIQKLQDRIEAAVARARALGVALVARRDWGVKHEPAAGWIPKARPNGAKEVCICGAIALAENPTNGKGILRAIAKKYGITFAQAASLSDGFEAFGANNHSSKDAYKLDHTWYRIGRKWRERADRVESRTSMFV